MDASRVKILWCMEMLHKKGQGTKRHNHEFYHYIYVREGTGHAVIGGQEVLLTPHNAYPFNPLTDHEFVAEEGMRLLEIKFEVSDPALAEGLSHLATVIPTEPTETERILRTILSETDGDDEWSADHRRTLLLEWLILLLRQSRQASEGGSDSPDLLAVVRYMRAHYGENLKNEDLAALLHMERTYFIKRFKQRFGVPPKHYLTALRMERAAALLENSGTGITKIGELCGFGSIHHFSNAFRTHFGISPAQYREKHTKK